MRAGRLSGEQAGQSYEAQFDGTRPVSNISLVMVTAFLHGSNTPCYGHAGY